MTAAEIQSWADPAPPPCKAGVPNIQGKAPHGRAQCQGHKIGKGHKAGNGHKAGKGHKDKGAAGSGVAGHSRAGHLGEGPVLSDTDKGQPLFEAQGPLRAFHNIHKVDVAIPNLLNLHHQLTA